MNNRDPGIPIAGRKQGKSMTEARGGGLSADEMYAQYLAGDEAAFDGLVALFETDLTAFIYSHIGDRYEAKQLMIESLARLATSNKFIGRSSVKTYLYAIAKNLAADHMRARSKEQLVSFDELVGVQAPYEDTTAQRVEREEGKRRVRAVMSALKEEYRTVLELLYFEDLSRTEAALRLNMSTKQVSDLAFRAKKSLKKKLDETAL